MEPSHPGAANERRGVVSTPAAPEYDYRSDAGNTIGPRSRGGRAVGRGGGRRDPLPRRDGGSEAPGWSPATPGKRTRAAWSSRPPPRPIFFFKQTTAYEFFT